MAILSENIRVHGQWSEFSFLIEVND